MKYTDPIEEWKKHQQDRAQVVITRYTATINGLIERLSDRDFEDLAWLADGTTPVSPNEKREFLQSLTLFSTETEEYDGRDERDQSYRLD